MAGNRAVSGTPKRWTAPAIRRILNVYTNGGALKTRIQKWGNSLGLRIPKSLAEDAEVEAGSQVDLTVKGGDLIVKPVRRPRIRLQSLLSKITKKNIHKELSAGDAVGKEVW
jgi:antitoxin MazE